MFKVSFKGDFKKVTVFNNKVTEVTLTGVSKFPSWWNYLPSGFYNWVVQHPAVKIEGYSMVEEVVIKISGKSKVHDGETFNPILGERIAEARAKIKLYKFMHTLCGKIMTYYNSIIYGKLYGKGDIHTRILPDYYGGLQDALCKYSTLWNREIQHLNKLLEQA